MNMRVSPPGPSTKPAGIGQSLPRNEDATLVRGEGRYTDDLSLDGQLHAVFVRSPYAHGVIRGIDVVAAREMPGVVAVYTAGDLEGQGYGALTCNVDIANRDGSPMKRPLAFSSTAQKP